jgi:hypothetical protein
VSPGFTFKADTLFDMDRPASPITTFATFEFEPAISVAVPTAVLGITVPVVPAFTCARNETEPLAGEVIYPPFTVQLIFCPVGTPPLYTVSIVNLLSTASVILKLCTLPAS